MNQQHPSQATDTVDTAPSLAAISTPADAAGLSAAQAMALRTRLLARVAHSAAQHRGLRTIRQADAAWQTLKQGVRACVLHDSGASRSVLVEFAPGSSLPSHQHLGDEECLVLSGSLQAGECEVGPHDYHLAPAGSRHAPIRSRHGALAFLRGTTIGNSRDMLREMLGAWLPLRRRSKAFTIAHAAPGWQQYWAGAFVKPLWRKGATASMLLRLEAGARVPAHLHRVDEECLLLSGEVFVGDMLLRAGEYQHASVGTAHGELLSEQGALLFIHGDAALALAAH